MKPDHSTAIIAFVQFTVKNDYGINGFWGCNPLFRYVQTGYNKT